MADGEPAAVFHVFKNIQHDIIYTTNVKEIKFVDYICKLNDVSPIKNKHVNLHLGNNRIIKFHII